VNLRKLRNTLRGFQIVQRIWQIVQTRKLHAILASLMTPYTGQYRMPMFTELMRQLLCMLYN